MDDEALLSKFKRAIAVMVVGAEGLSTNGKERLVGLLHTASDKIAPNRDWCDWLQDELRSLSADERVAVITSALDHSSTSRGLPVRKRFELAETLRDTADKLERTSVVQDT